MDHPISQPLALNKNFASDNTAGVSPEILQALSNINDGPMTPYGGDEVTIGLEKTFSEIFEHEVRVFLVNSGSAANALGLSILTPPWGHVLCHPDSHIYNDECAAPEVFNPGSRLIPVNGENSKIDPELLQDKLSLKIGDVHATQPTTISLTQSTETGSNYSLDELQAFGDICKNANLNLHMDGARFANALVSLDCSPADMTWKRGVDVLSFGTTKNGTMTAEVIVLFDPKTGEEMGYRRKRSGHLTSKMRFLSAQVEAYLQDDLWLKNARHANTMAKRLIKGLSTIEGIEFQGQTETNIIFCKMDPLILERLHAQGFVFYANRWGPNIARLVTSFATTKDDVDALIHAAKSP